MTDRPELSSFCFDSNYLSGLRQRNATVGTHFVAYFSQDLDRWLWPRLRSSAAVEDVRQETLCRVFSAVQRNLELHDPARLPLFVHGVCRRVLLEYWRKSRRTTPWDQHDLEETDDGAIDPEQRVSAAENWRLLRHAVGNLPPETRDLISLVYFQECSRAEVSKTFGVNQTYLRVLIHRAILQLRTALKNPGRCRAIA